MRDILNRLFGNSFKPSEKRNSIKDEILTNKNINSDEKQAIIKFIDLVFSTVENVIIPRSDIKGIQISADFFSCLRQFAEVNDTQLIVYENSLDKIVGYIDFADVVPYMDYPKEFLIDKIKKDITFIVPNMKIVDAVKQMQSNGSHNLIIVDEFGGVDGMVSMDRILNEVFGEPLGVSTSHALIIPTPIPGEFLVDARIPIDVCEEKLNVKLLIPIDETDEMPDIETLGGLITAIFGKVPSIGDIINHKSGVQFVIKDANLRKVLKVLVKTNVAVSGK